MVTFLTVHGYDPGPSQRPLLSGAVSGILATFVALPILIGCGSLEVEARILGLTPILTIGIGWLAMAIAGALYARLFGRPANDVRGGWLFGLAFGFSLWAGGAVLILPLLSGGRAPAGTAGIGVALSMLAWGLAIGILQPFVHRPFHEGLRKASRHIGLGPNAAASKNQPGRQRPQKKA